MSRAVPHDEEHDNSSPRAAQATRCSRQLRLMHAAASLTEVVVAVVHEDVQPAVQQRGQVLLEVVRPVGHEELGDNGVAGQPQHQLHAKFVLHSGRVQEASHAARVRACSGR